MKSEAFVSNMKSEAVVSNRTRDRRSRLGWPGAVLLLAAGAAVGASQGPPGTTNTGAQRTSRVIRTVDGHPDLEGIWNFSSLTPFERPTEFAGKEFVTGAEA